LTRHNVNTHWNPENLRTSVFYVINKNEKVVPEITFKSQNTIGNYGLNPRSRHFFFRVAE